MTGPAGHDAPQMPRVLGDQLRTQVDAAVSNPQLRAFLREEQTWLARTQALLAEVRPVRQQEVARFWPAIWRRWILAPAFALASAAAAGAAYGWVVRPCAAEELEAFRARVELADTIARSVLTMTPPERRQFDPLMKWNAPTTR